MNPYIIAGLVIFAIGFALWFSSPSGYLTSPQQPNPPLLGPLSYIASVSFFIVAIYSFIQFVNHTFNQGLFIIYLALTVVSVFLTVGAFKFGREAASNFLRNMKCLADAKGEHVRYEQNQIALEHARENAEHDQKLREQTTKTHIREQEVRRTQLGVTEQEAVLRGEMIPVARQAGLGVDGVYKVNEHKYLKQIDLRNRWEETEQDLTAADFADSSQQRQVLSERRKELEQLIRERSRVNREEPDDYVKNKLLERYDKGIKNLEDEIDSREARLVLPKVAQENRRLT